MVKLTNFEEKILPYISDGYFLVDNKTRQMTLMGADNQEMEGIFYIGAQLDVNIQHVIVKLPNKYEGKELKNATHAYICLQVNNQEIGRAKIDNSRQYYDDNYVYIDWIVGPEATEMAGQAFLSLCLQNKQNDTTIEWEFNSQPVAAQIVQTLPFSEDLVAIEHDIFENIDSWASSDYIFLTDTSIINWSAINSNNTIYIDKTTRALTLPDDFDFGIETDHNMKYVFVAFPKIYEGTNFNTVDWKYYASYTNAEGESDKSLLITNAEKADDNYIYVAWIITIGITEASGSVQFSFVAVHNDNRKIEQAWNTLYDSAFVNKTVIGGEKLVIDEFQIALEAGLTAYFANNNVIFDGDIW